MIITFNTIHRLPLFMLAATALLMTCISSPAKAQESMQNDMMPPQAENVEQIAVMPGDATHPAVRLTPDKSEMIDLGEKARSVIVGNEAHVRVIMDSPQRLIIIPRAPGATFFSVIGEDGKVIMQRHAIVAAPKDKYVRVRRSCVNASGSCEETSVYYCPGMCHDVQIQTQTRGSTSFTDLMSSMLTGAMELGENQDGTVNFAPPEAESAPE